MKLTMKPLALACAATLLITACKKDSDPTKTELIAKSSWTYDSGGADFNADGNADISFTSIPGFPTCTLDNKATFNSNGTGVGDEGATKCNSSDPQTTNFGWGFETNETVLSISGNVFAGLGGKFKLKELTDTKLTLTKDTAMSGTATTLIVNLKH